jgi:serine-type D-Ala-D-Ala carboxypeptidase
MCSWSGKREKEKAKVAAWLLLRCVCSARVASTFTFCLFPFAFIVERVSIETYLHHELDLGSFAGAAYAVGSFDAIDTIGALGNAVAVPLRIPATIDTIWDCASITKPLITTTLVLQAVAEGKLALDDRVELLPFDVRYRDLLTHTSGLAAWLPLYAFDDYLDAIRTRGRERDRGEKVIYSDLNFVLLYMKLEEIYGDYVALAREKIFEPLGISGEAMFRPKSALLSRIAATEWGQRFEAGMARDRKIESDRFRQGLMWGQANDGNSHHHGGTAGNAGLFATVRAVFRLAQSWAHAELLPRELVDEATRNQTEGMNEARGLGWQLPAPDNEAAAPLSPRAYGHSGFTGTSVWIDPTTQRIYVLLTNRVHPAAIAVPMQKIRGEFHRLASR